MERYYRKELAHLKGVAAEFAAAHPALAPMLRGPSADPDVERLLEGVAFQTAVLRQKLDDDLPDLVQQLAALIFPHYLRPIPATTIVAFSPKPSLPRTETIPAGVQLASVPVEGTRCLFRTCAPVEIHPLQLSDAAFEAPALTLRFALQGLSTADWSPRSLRLFLAGPEAPEIYLLLCRSLQRIVLHDEQDSRLTVLPKECLQPAGFAQEEALIPYPPQSFPLYRLLQEYFTIPQRFLFLDLLGWERWLKRGNGSTFSIRFELDHFRDRPPKVRRDSFVLFAAPAVNLFKHDAAPLHLDHRAERYLVRPEGLTADQAQVFSVDRVTGFGAGGERVYHPFDAFRTAASPPCYNTTTVSSSQGPETYLTFAYHKDAGLPHAETLSLALTCSNGTLADGLGVGDLCECTASPDFAGCRNILPVTPALLPRFDEDLLGRLVAHLSLNRRAPADAADLRAILRLYLFEDSLNHASVAANRKRIEGMAHLVTEPAELVLDGMRVRGRNLRIAITEDNFAGRGDIFLFGTVVSHFLAGCAAINTFTSTTFDLKVETLLWKPQHGQPAVR
jgi:type VI secretion system protein ImpG